MTDPSAIIGCLCLLGWIYLALFHGRFWLPLMAKKAPPPAAWPRIDIVVPARDEAPILPRTLPSLLAQDYPGEWKILLIDDHSADGTGKTAAQIAARENHADKLVVIAAPDIPAGWRGKVAAMQTGVNASDADYILFTDADIEHPADSLRRLAARAVARKLDLASLMVKLHCRTRAEKLLVPPFVLFFAMLYPFVRVNNPQSPVAAAAGGVMLVRRKALDAIGGFARIKGALIDDCALGKALKQGTRDARGRIELTLSRDVKSLRVYHDRRDVWKMIARSAFTQLNHSALLLLGTVIGMGLLFFAPLLLIFAANPVAVIAALVTLVIMIGIYIPMVRFYDLPASWALTLPLAALIYLGATIDSARLYWQGRGGEWKGRHQS